MTVDPAIYETIRAATASAVPFARHAGIEITRVANGEGSAQLAQTDTSVNHIGSQHAGALYTLGEAASGAAMSGAFATVMMSVRPVAAEARIAYKRVAKGLITANARTSEPGADLLATLHAEGKAAFDVDVTLTDESGDTVAEMTVRWDVRQRR